MSLLGWKIEEESMDIWEPEIHDWSSPEETSAFFGAAVAESHYTDDVVIDSCTSSRVDDEEDAEDLFERHLAGLGEDVHTFDVSRSAETRKGSSHSGLSVRIEGDDRVGGGADVPTDSVVSTPEVLEEVITLECDDQFQLIYGDSFPQTADDLFVTRKQLEEDEYVVEFVDATHFEGFSAASSNENTMDTTTTTPTESSAYSSAVEEEDTDDEEYTPVSSPKRRTTRRSNKHVAITPAKRGRPAKPLRTTLTARELANLEPEAKKHKELRFKNNEASRLSRFKRRQKDLLLNDQCENYERENVDLRKMLKRHKKLHKELRAMIVGIKIR